jgi:hypothetical protein
MASGSAPLSQRCVSAAVVLAIGLWAALGHAVPFQHDFGTVRSMMCADYNAPELLTPAQAAFIATHYSIVSLEKCTGG